MATTTLTRCEQAAVDLARIKALWEKAIGGTNVVRLGQADKSLQYGLGDAAALEREKRRLQAIVDRCDGCRSANRFIRMQPEDGGRC